MKRTHMMKPETDVKISSFTPRDGASIAEWQESVRALVAARGWTADPDEVFIRMTEELGEVAKELRRRWKHGDANRDAAGAELADVFLYLADLANGLGVDLDAATRKKLAYNDGRTWDH